MKIVNIADLEATGIYHEFLRVPALSLGLYKHPVGTNVPQDPHAEDEVYYVVSGNGKIAVNGSDYSVSTGAVVYVPARVPHHFHSVTTDLQVLVFFSPAEHTLA
ncbi:MAG: cupin domain-containing protein [Acidobacteriia bacterium]|nr:cupin domain-containing protein [Terriglobia bacterium]